MTNILLVTVTKTETQAVFKAFSKAPIDSGVRQHIGEKTYYALGALGGADVFLVQSEMGTGTPGGALITIHKAIEALSPTAVIMVGIAFGLIPKDDKHPDDQELGHILVAKQIMAYELGKIKDGFRPRGDRVTCSPMLLGKFRDGDMDWVGAKVWFGLVLSGEKLVAYDTFRAQLLAIEPEAIGGEMEGAGLYAAASDAKVDWIMVKAICDWADGDKKDDAQPLAAKNAAEFVRHVIGLGGWEQAGSTHITSRGYTASNILQPRDDAPIQGNQQALNDYENAVFVSYAWGGESESTVDELERAFAERGISIVRDKKDLIYKGSIKEFVQRIGRGQCVVLVISDKYLRSEYCMYELVEVDENRNLRQRVFPIVLPDARIYEPIERLAYVHYWDEKIDELNQAIKDVKVMTNLPGFTADLDKYGRIRSKFDHLTDLLRDMNTLTPEDHAARGFSTLISAVKRGIVGNQAIPQDSIGKVLADAYSDDSKSMLLSSVHEMGVEKIYFKGFSPKFKKQLSGATRIRIMMLSGQGFIRNEMEEIIKALVNNRAHVQVLLGEEDSMFVLDTDEMEWEMRSPKNPISYEIKIAREQLNYHAEILSKKGEGEVGKLEVGTYSTQLRSTLIICNEDWGWLTFSLPPEKGTNSISLELFHTEQGLLPRSIKHFDRCWEIVESRQKVQKLL